MAILAIESSSRPYRVAIGTSPQDGASFIAADAEDGGLLSALVERALETLEMQPSQVTQIAVNRGPGGLGAIRDGLAFASGFALGLSIPVYTFNSFELMGHQARSKPTSEATLCICRGRRGSVISGVFDGRDVSAWRYEAIASFKRHMEAFHGSSMVAGNLRSLALEGPGEDRFIDSGVETPLPQTMIEIGLEGRAGVYPSVHPLSPLVFDLEKEDG